MPLAVAGLAAAARDGYRGRGAPAGLAAIALGQVACFSVLKAAEAVAAGTGPAPTLGQPALWAGLVLQVAVALGAAGPGPHQRGHRVVVAPVAASCPPRPVRRPPPQLVAGGHPPGRLPG